MPITWYTSPGQPSDSVGVDGDLNWDTSNRITWGPKGKVNPGSWAGTAYSNIGPAGPAMLSGIGAPASGFGQNGNGYTDVASGQTYYKSNNAWTPAGSIVGPQGLAGAPGQAAAPFAGAMQGPAAILSGVTTLSATPTVMSKQTSADAAIYVPSAPSYFLGGCLYVATGTVVVELYDQTAGVSIFKSASYSTNSILPLGPLPAASAAAGGYPLTAGNTYVWRATGSGAAVVSIDPIYFDSVSVPLALGGTSLISGFNFPAPQSTTTAQIAKLGNSTTAYRYLRAGSRSYLHQAVITNNSTSGYVTAYCAVVASGGASGTVLATAIDAGGALRQVQPGETFTTPVYGTLYQFAAATNYSWFTNGTATGPVTISCRVQQ